MKLLITGGAGFMGSHFVRASLHQQNVAEAGSAVCSVVCLDMLTYAGKLQNLSDCQQHPNFIFVRGDVCDATQLAEIFQRYQPDAVVHFAAETHVDRSIKYPEAFIQTNIVGSYQLLEATRHFWTNLSSARRAAFRFLHISTDEVYGALGVDDAPLDEMAPYRPNSPYSASKAASDHLVRAWHHTYGLPVLTVHSSNNYGPQQFPEKLIPLCIHKALAGEVLPIYGDGQQMRDWLYVEDFCGALWFVLQQGVVGQTYNLSSGYTTTNLQLIEQMCALLDQMQPRLDGASYRSLIGFVPDRPGHDRRYALSQQKIQQQLGWRATTTIEVGLRKTLDWYLQAKVSPKEFA